MDFAHNFLGLLLDPFNVFSWAKVMISIFIRLRYRINVLMVFAVLQEVCFSLWGYWLPPSVSKRSGHACDFQRANISFALSRGDCSHGDTRRSPAAQVDNMAPRREAIEETNSLHRFCRSASGQHASHSGRYVGNLILFTCSIYPSSNLTKMTAGAEY